MNERYYYNFMNERYYYNFMNERYYYNFMNERYYYNFMNERYYGAWILRIESCNNHKCSCHSEGFRTIQKLNKVSTDSKLSSVVMLCFPKEKIKPTVASS